MQNCANRSRHHRTFLLIAERRQSLSVLDRTPSEQTPTILFWILNSKIPTETIESPSQSRRAPLNNGEGHGVSEAPSLERVSNRHARGHMMDLAK